MAAGCTVLLKKTLIHPNYLNKKDGVIISPLHISEYTESNKMIITVALTAHHTPNLISLTGISCISPGLPAY